MTLKDSKIHGICRFKVKLLDLRSNSTQISGSASIYFNEIKVNGFHSTNAKLNLLPIRFEGNGPYVVTLNGLEMIIFIKFKKINDRFNIDHLSLNLSIKSANVNFQGLGPLTNLFNIALSSAFPFIISLANEEINIFILNQVIPLINNLINRRSALIEIKNFDF